MNTPYQPIDCSVHDQLLALATLRRECELLVASPGAVPRRIRGIIVDVYSRDGAEYLRLRDETTVRLDHIEALDGSPVAGSHGLGNG